MNILNIEIDKIESKEDFINFINLLSDDFKVNQHEWENKTIESFLEAASSWTEDMDYYYNNNKMPIPVNINWKVFANILMAAKMYE